MPVQTATPRVLTDAVEVLANPARYANRPFLIHLARLVAQTAANHPAPQRRLRLVQGGAA